MNDRTSLEEDQQDRPLEGAKVLGPRMARKLIPGYPFWVPPTSHPRGKSCRLANNYHATSQTLLSRSPIYPTTVLKINHLYESALRWHYIFLWSDNPSKVTRKINTTTEQRWKSLNLAIHFSFSTVPEKRLILFSVLWKVWFEKKLFSIRSYFAPDNVMYAKLHPISFVQTEIFQLFAEIFSISMLCNTWLSVDSSLPAEAYHVTQPSLYRSSHQIHLQISELRQMRLPELFKHYIKTPRIANGPAHLLLAIRIPGLQI